VSGISIGVLGVGVTRGAIYYDVRPRPETVNIGPGSVQFLLQLAGN
jgi:hypothetical protein